ncbi:MAG: class F sortase [Pseudonocardiaceae bacterium]|nr:class F sortase [Pseudonocardiaceae bacterium]
MTGRHVDASNKELSWGAASTEIVRVSGVSLLVVGSAIVIAAVLVLSVGAAAGPETTAPPQQQVPEAASEQASEPTGEQAADPVRVRIPAIGVDAPVQAVIVDENGVLPPPDTFEGTGWWQAGPEPGETGPAVIAGHVDSYRGPAVFYELNELEQGAEILVDRADGSTVSFIAQRTEQYDKDEFPTESVYGDTPDPQLRLITCGGTFDEDGRTYLDNIVTYATVAG